MTFDCGFWIETNFTDEIPLKRFRFSTSALYPELSNPDGFLTDGFEKLNFTLSFYPKLKTTHKGYLYENLTTKYPPLLALVHADLNAAYEKELKKHFTFKCFRIKRATSKCSMSSSIDESFAGSSIFQLSKMNMNPDSLTKYLKTSLVGIGTKTVYDPTVRQASEISGQVYCFPCADMWKIFKLVYSKFLL